VADVKTKLPLAATIAISVGFHAVLIGGALAFRPLEPLTLPEHGEPIQVLVVTDPEPVAVVLFDDVAEKVVAIATHPTTDPAMDRKSRVMRVVAARAGTSAVTHAPADAITPGTEANHQPHSMFQMRDKRAAVFSLKKDEPAVEAR
jgi:hypothetical protein